MKFLYNYKNIYGLCNKTTTTTKILNISCHFKKIKITSILNDVSRLKINSQPLPSGVFFLFLFSL